MAETLNSAAVALTTNTITDIYQAPNGASTDRALVMSCLVSNVDGVNNASITIDITNSSNVKVGNIATLVVVPAKASLEFVVNKLVLKNGQKIRATAAVANDLEVTVSALEVT